MTPVVKSWMMRALVVGSLVGGESAYPQHEMVGIPQRVISIGNVQLLAASDPDRKAPSTQGLSDAPETLVIENAALRLQAFPFEDRMPMSVSQRS
jgi:hypothetical protein